MAKCVDLFVVGSPHSRVTSHAPDDRQRARYEHKLHQGVVQGYEVREQIQIASQKNQRVQLLSLERNPFTTTIENPNHRFN